MSRCDKAKTPVNWPSTNGSFCSAEQQSPIDLCGAVQLGTFGYRDSRYKLHIHHHGEKKIIKVNTEGQAKIMPPDDFSFYVNSNEISFKVGRQDQKPETADDSKWKFAQVLARSIHAHAR